MKISVFFDHLQEAAKQSNISLEEVIQKVSSQGVTGIEINLTCLIEQEEKILALLKEYNMNISCIYEFYDWGNNQALDYGKKHVDMAKKTGAGNILVVPGFLSTQETIALEQAGKEKEALYQFMQKSKTIQQMKENLQELVDYAETKQITVTLEDFDSKEAPFATKWQLLWFMEQVKGLRFTMDIGNFVYSDEDAIEGFQLLKTWMVHMHCKDRGKEVMSKKYRYNKGMETCATGMGYLPIKQIVQEAMADGYDGYYAIEHFGAKNQLALIEKSAEFLQSIGK